MRFSDTDLSGMLSAFDASEVIVKLAGVTVKTIAGDYRSAAEVVSPYNAEEVAVMPVVICRASDLTDVTRSHTLTVDGETYKLFGNPSPYGSGFAQVALVKA